MSQTALLFAVILTIGMIVQIMADLYSPALPAIAEYFNVSIDVPQWSIAAYMITVALSQLLYGPLSEVIGRKKAVLLGLAILLVGSIICVQTETVELLIIGRIIQGFGAGACAALWRTIFRDSFKGEELAKYASYLSVVVAFILPVAPMIGGYLQAFFGWRANFIFLTIYTIIAIFGVMFFFKESNHAMSNEHKKLSSILEAYKTLLMSPLFMGMSSCVFLGYGAIFAWFAVGPALIIDQLGVAPQDFGLYNAVTAGVPFALTAWLNGRYVKKLGMAIILRFAWTVMILSSSTMLIIYSIWGMSVLGIMIPLAFFYFGVTFIWPNAFAISFSPFGHIAGYAGALYGLMQLGGGGAISSIMAYLPDNNPIPFATTALVAPIISLFLFEKLVKPNMKEESKGN